MRGFAPIATRHYPLPPDKARFVGEPVAIVVAETHRRRPRTPPNCSTSTTSRCRRWRARRMRSSPGAPRAVGRGARQSLHRHRGRRRGRDRGRLRRAAHVVRLDTWVQRVTGVPMEPRTNIAEYDAASGHYTLYTGSGRGVAKVRLDLAAGARRAGRAGARACAATWAAISAPAISSTPNTRCSPGRRAGSAGRSNGPASAANAFLSDYQGRDLTVEAELALDEEGNFLAVRGSNLSNLGAHAVAFGPLQKGLGLMSSVYRIPVGYFRGRGAVTNTVSTTPYRSAGRPEAIFVIERLVDLAADQLGLDPVALRRRNMIPPAAQPYANPLGLTYDSGRYEEAMDTRAGARRLGRVSRRAAPRRGDAASGAASASPIMSRSPRGAPRERTEITVLPEGRVELVMGTMSSGQGHETSFAQLVTEWLGVPFDSIDYVAHDTARVEAGGGSHSGRSMKLAATIVGQATDEIIDKGRKIASFLLETGEVDIEFAARPLPGRRHRSRDRPLRGRRRRGRRARICRRSCKGRSPASATRHCRSRAFPTARKSARSRSIPRPVLSRSSAMPRSTMSAARSIR